MPRTQKPVAISIDPELHIRAKARAKGMGFKHSFSAYVQKLIEEDVEAFEAAQSKRQKKAA